MNTMVPFEPPEWAKCIQNIPHSIVQLAVKPTPIHQWNIPDVPNPFTVHVKRDDLTGSTLSGNKVRKNEFLLGEALEKNCDVILACGAITSNQCRTVACASRQLGMEPYLFLKSPNMVIEDLGYRGNAVLNRLTASNVILVPHGDYDKVVHPRMWKMEKKLRSEGKNPYVILRGGSTFVAMFSYIAAFEEMIQQGLFENFDDIVVIGASGGTASGLAIASYLTGLRVKVHAVNITRTVPDILDHIDKDIQKAGLDVKAADIIDIMDGYKGAGHSANLPEELEDVLKFSSATGIMCDPVYNVKGVRAMVTEMKKNPKRFKGTRIIYIHTGGIFGLFSDRLDSLLKCAPAANKVYLWRNLDDPPPC